MPASVPPRPDEEPAEELARPDVNLATLAAPAPDERELTGLMRDWRRGRATQSIWSALSESYVTVFSLVVIGAMVVNVVMDSQRNAAACTSASCLSARALLPWALLAGVLALALMLARMFGPVVASAAEGFWLLDAPVRRRRLLGGRLLAIIVASGLVGAGLGALLAALVGSAGVAVASWALATGLGAAAVVAFAAAEQGAERLALVKVGQAVAALAATAVLAAVVANAAGWIALQVGPSSSLVVAWTAAAAAAVVLLASAAVAWARVHLIRRARLASGGALVQGMQGAAFALDFGLMRDILVEREMREKGHVTPTLGRGVGTSALVWRDVQRLLRKPLPLVVVLASAIVPYALAALGLGAMNPFLSGVVLCFLLVPLMGQLRVLTRTPGLSRLLPFSTGQTRTAAMTVPFAVALVWGMLASPAFAGLTDAPGAARLSLPAAALHALLTAVAGLLGAVRWTVAKSANYNVPTMATPMGAMPPSMMFSLFRGFDIVAVVTFPIVLGLPWWVSGLLALFTFTVLRGGMNMEELQAEQERQKKLAEQARAERNQPREKIRLQR